MFALADRSAARTSSKPIPYLDKVKSFAYYPYAVAIGIDDFRDGEISMRFKIVAGQLGIELRDPPPVQFLELNGQDRKR